MLINYIYKQIFIHSANFLFESFKFFMRCDFLKMFFILFFKEKLIAIVLGMLRQHNFEFVDVIREEAFTALKATIKQVNMKVWFCFFFILWKIHLRIFLHKPTSSGCMLYTAGTRVLGTWMKFGDLFTTYKHFNIYTISLLHVNLSSYFYVLINYNTINFDLYFPSFYFC